MIVQSPSSFWENSSIVHVQMNTTLKFKKIVQFKLENIKNQWNWCISIHEFLPIM